MTQRINITSLTIGKCFLRAEGPAVYQSYSTLVLKALSFLSKTEATSQGSRTFYSKSLIEFDYVLKFIFHWQRSFCYFLQTVSHLIKKMISLSDNKTSTRDKYRFFYSSYRKKHGNSEEDAMSKIVLSVAFVRAFFPLKTAACGIYISTGL